MLTTSAQQGEGDINPLLPTIRTSDVLISSSTPADRHPAAVYLASLAPGSRRTMRHALDTITSILTSGQQNAETLDWTRIEYHHTAAIRAALAARYAPAMCNKMLTALRGVLKQAWRLGYTDAETYARAADLPPVKGSRPLRGRALTSGELRALFDSCATDPSPIGVRDAALLAVLYCGGLRRSEVVSLDLASYNAETGALTLTGKGSKSRVTYVTGAGQDALADWLALRGDAPGPLFWPVLKGGHLRPRRLTDHTMLDVVRRRAAEAGVPMFSPHDLRRTFISDLLDAGADIATAQQLAGHANVQTTAKYDRRGEVVKQKAAGLLHVPYTRRQPVGVGRR